MESYVWNLTHGLSRRGLCVRVVCEELIGLPDCSVSVFELGNSSRKSRWRSMLEFRARVDSFIREQFKGDLVIIHSHERSLSHQVTTFHGQPLHANRLSRFLIRRVRGWLSMERHEICGPNVQAVLPVSSIVERELLKRYPELSNKFVTHAWPGVSVETGDVKLNANSEGAGKIVFVGSEWKRKGLDIAVQAVREYRKHDADATLSVFGVDASELPRSIRCLDWVLVHGWSGRISWEAFDLLLHPARYEAFGMVIAEARSFGLPVIMSSKVGASDLGFSESSVVKIDAGPEVWADLIKRHLLSTNRNREFKWTWKDLVNQHINIIYPNIRGFVV
ncbi:glycosyltransferase family 4 protein [Litoricolaceae bacterium]|nr:glycosyltransferase family 4 protein [Litorivicinaceae bacterium]